MMDIKDPEQKKSYFTFVSLAGTPVFKSVSSWRCLPFSWGMYLVYFIKWIFFHWVWFTPGT